MLIIPSIDLLEGRCVRLYKGDYARVTVYSEDPVGMARAFEEAGARLIHVVDLDRARDGADGNRRVIRALVKSVSAAVEVGGGVRARSDVTELLDSGVKRIVIGTALVRAPELVAGWIARHAFHPIAGLDACDGFIKVQGWTDDAGLRDDELAARCRELGFREIIYTNIDVDGTLAGPDIASTNRVAEAGRLPVILSGGIGSAKDVARVAREKTDLVKGVIIGKAYYEKKIDLAALIRAHQGPPPAAQGES